MAHRAAEPAQPALKIISNEEVKTAVEKFVIAKGTVTTELKPAGIRLLAELGERHVPAKNFIALLKFDPFTSAWKAVTADFANQDSDFITNNVQKALGAAGR